MLTETGFDGTVGDTIQRDTKLALIRRWIALSAAYGNGFIGLYSYESDTHLADPHRNASTSSGIDEIGQRLAGRTIRRAAMLVDGSVWVELEGGTTLRI